MLIVDASIITVNITSHPIGGSKSHIISDKLLEYLGLDHLIN